MLGILKAKECQGGKEGEGSFLYMVPVAWQPRKERTLPSSLFPFLSQSKGPFSNVWVVEEANAASHSLFSWSIQTCILI